MKYLPHAIWALVSIAAFAFGFSRAGHRQHPNDGGGTSNSAQGSRAGSGDQNGTTGISALTAGSTTADALSGKSTNPAPLSATDIAALGDAFRTEKDPIARRLAFNRLLEGLTAENALQIREQIAHLSPGSSEFRDFHYAWGAKGGSDAVMHGADTRERDMAVTLAGWASVDIDAATAWLDGLPDKGHDIDELRRGLVEGMANTNSEGASEYVFQFKGGERLNLLGIVAGKVITEHGLTSATGWASHMPPGEFRDAALQHVAGRYFHADREGAAAWAAEMAKQGDGGTAVATLGQAWVIRDPKGAMNWLGSLPAGAAQSAGMKTAFHEWAGRDSKSASRRLLKMPSSPGRDAAIQGFASRLRHDDPEAAVIWAGEIADPEVRTSTTVQAGQTFMQRNPQAASEWLAGSGLGADLVQKIESARK